MKAIVTGGAGFIGSHVVDGYVNQGFDVLVVDDLSTGRIENLNPAARFERVDVRSPEFSDLIRDERPKLINHHAAQISVKVSTSRPMFDADVNIVGSVRLLEAARKSGVSKVVYSASGGTAYGEPEYLPCDEKHPISPISPYGISKHTVERYLEMYHSLYGLDYVALRYPNVYGPRQDPHGEAGVIAIFVRQMLDGSEVTIDGSGDQERDFVFVSDIAEANLLAATSDATGVFNIGSSHGTSVNSVFRVLRKYTSYSRRATAGPARVGDVYRTYLDASLAESVLGWRPVVGLEDGLSATVDFFRFKATE